MKIIKTHRITDKHGVYRDGKWFSLPDPKTLRKISDFNKQQEKLRSRIGK